MDNLGPRLHMISKIDYDNSLISGPKNKIDKYNKHLAANTKI